MEKKFRALAEDKNGKKRWFFYTTRTGNLLTQMCLSGKIKRWIVQDLLFTGLKDKNGKEIYEGDVIKLRPFGDEDIREETVTDNNDFFEWKGLREGEYSEEFVSENIELIKNLYY